MKGNDLLKIGFGGLLVYAILKELNQTDDNVSYQNNNPSQTLQVSQSWLTPEEINNIVANIRANWVSAQPASDSASSLLEAQTTKPSPDPQTIEASNWLRLIHHP